jgi:hypothetical protein
MFGQLCIGKLNLILRNLFGMITEWSPTFSPKLSRILILLGNIHHHIPVVFTSVEVFVRGQACWVKCKFSLKKIPTTWLVCNIYIGVRSNVVYCCKRELNLISILPQVSEQYAFLRVHTYHGCISNKCSCKVLCLNWNTFWHWEAI